jgi:hypothetical protein
MRLGNDGGTNMPMNEEHLICTKHRRVDCEECMFPHGICDWCGRVLGRKHLEKGSQRWCSFECAATDLGVEEVE